MVKKTHSHTQKVIRIELKISLNPNSTNVISRTWIGLCGMPSKSVSQSVSVPAYCSCKWVSEEIDGWWPVQYTLNAEYINQNIYVNFSSEHSHAWTWANVPAPDSRRVCMCVRIAYAGCSMNSIWNLLFHRIHLRVLCAFCVHYYLIVSASTTILLNFGLSILFTSIYFDACAFFLLLLLLPPHQTAVFLMKSSEFMYTCTLYMAWARTQFNISTTILFAQILLISMIQNIFSNLSTTLKALIHTSNQAIDHIR